jgi:cytosine/adenosine deaminase-related metal-dependent hydrolase
LAEEHLQAWQGRPRLQAGLSPHAPYTVHPDLMAGAVSLSRRYACPIAMHVAESREEIRLLARGDGPFADLLRERGVWRPELFGGRAIGELLRTLAGAWRVLVVHGNYLTAEDRELVAAHAERMSVIYCPRTQAWFGHDAYPLAEMLAAGVPVALGTDSRASNPDLSLLAEMRYIARHHPAVRPAEILELGTLAGARALGQAADHGSIAPGRAADLIAVALPAQISGDPHAALFDDEAEVAQVWLAGQRVV